MAELIDRAALLERIDAKFFASDPKGEEQIGYLNSRTLVRTAPAVDAAEVVRCKDCIYYKTGEYFKDMKFCFRLKYPKKNKQVGYNYPEDGFCSYGKRRTDGSID
jgi:hypothetical protein